MIVKNSKGTKKIIVLLGIVMPLVVAVLYVLPKPENMNPGIKTFLENSPQFNACINATTFILLILSLVAIKAKKSKIA